MSGVRSWAEGSVDPAGEHFRLSYGEAFADGNVEVARLAQDGQRCYLVEFLISDDDFEEAADALGATRRELDFYLDELEHPGNDAWPYAVYHCSTMANVYSKVHWAYYPAGAASDA